MASAGSNIPVIVFIIPTPDHCPPVDGKKPGIINGPLSIQTVSPGPASAINGATTVTVSVSLDVQVFASEYVYIRLYKPTPGEIKIPEVETPVPLQVPALLKLPVNEIGAGRSQIIVSFPANTIGNGLLPCGTYFIIFDFGDGGLTPVYKDYIELKY